MNTERWAQVIRGKQLALSVPCFVIGAKCYHQTNKGGRSLSVSQVSQCIDLSFLVRKLHIAICAGLERGRVRLVLFAVVSPLPPLLS